MSLREKAILKIAPPYDDALLRRIEEGFTGLLGFSVRFEVIEAPALLSGFIAYVDGVVYDMSGQTQLSNIRQHLLDAVIIPAPAAREGDDDA